MQLPDWRSPFRCHVDAISRAVGEALSQVDENENEHSIAYFSKLLPIKESN